MIQPIDQADWTYVLNVAAAYVDQRQLLATDREAANLAALRYRETIARLAPSFGDRSPGLVATANHYGACHLDGVPIERLDHFLAQRETRLPSVVHDNTTGNTFVPAPKRRAKTKRSPNA
jgi:hypothetical protein